MTFFFSRSDSGMGMVTKASIKMYQSTYANINNNTAATIIANHHDAAATRIIVCYLYQVDWISHVGILISINNIYTLAFPLSQTQHTRIYVQDLCLKCACSRVCVRVCGCVCLFLFKRNSKCGDDATALLYLDGWHGSVFSNENIYIKKIVPNKSPSILYLRFFSLSCTLCVANELSFWQENNKKNYF